MAVLRTSDPLRLDAGAGPKLQQSGAGAAAPDKNKFMRSSTPWAAVSAPPTVTVGGVRAQVPPSVGIISELFGKGSQLAQQQADVEKENAYLRGMAAVGAGVSESQIESNVLTRAWATAGYRDTVGRLQLAQSEAQITEDMQALREKSPQEFAAYLDQRRQELMPQFEGMSLAQRKTIFGQLLTSDRAAISLHAAEHSKFIIDQRFRGVQVALNTQVQKMNASKGTGTENQAVDSYMATLVSNSFLDPSLPVEIQESWAAQGIEYALGSGMIPVYDRASQDVVEFPDGSTGTILSRLPLDTQLKLGKAYRQALGAANSAGQYDYLTALGVTRAAIAEGDLPDRAAWDATLRTGVTNGWIEPSRVETLNKEYYGHVYKDSNQATLSSALASGNLQGIAQAGATITEAVDAWDTSARKAGKSVPERISGLLAVGSTHNVPEAHQKAGELLVPSIRRLGMEPGADPDAYERDLGIVQATMGHIDTLTAENRPAALRSMLAGMDEDTAAFVTEFYGNLGSFSGNAQEAAIQARKNLETAAATPAPLRAQRNQERDKAYTEYVSSLGATHLFSTMARVLPWGEDRDTIRPQGNVVLSSFRDDPEAVQEQVRTMQNYLYDEMVEVGRQHPTWSPDNVADNAVANLARRTIETPDGRLYLPRGVPAQQYFGTDPAEGTHSIGQALDRMAQDQFKSDGVAKRVTWKAYNGGRLVAELWNEDGLQYATTPVDAREVGKYIATLTEEKAAKAVAESGAGVTRTQKYGDKVAQVTYNGDNTSAVAPMTALKFRDNLVGSEAIRGEVYKDSVGVLTFGVGLSNKSDHWPGGLKEGDAVPQTVINETFMKASNQALDQASLAMRTAGLMGESATLLLAELAYQGGPIMDKNKPEMAELLAAMQVRDKEAAHKALLKTKPYKYSQGNSKEQTGRQKHYIRLLDNYLKGN